MKKEKITAEHIAAIKSIYDFCFSMDDKYLYYVTNLGEYFRVWAIPSGGGYPRQLSILENGDVKGIKLSPDGNTLALCVDYQGKEEFEIFTLPAEGGIPRKISENVKISMPVFEWSPDSNKIAVLDKNDEIFNVAVIEIDTLKVTHLTDSADVKLELDWSPDGEWIAYTSYEEPLRSNIIMVNTSTRETRNLTWNLKGENTGGKFSPDGKAIGFTSDSMGTRSVVLMNLETNEARWIAEKDCEQAFLRWKPSGDKFAYLRNKDSDLSIHETDYPPTESRRLSTTGLFGTQVRYPHQGDKIALKLAGPNRPGEIYLREAKTLRKITNCTVFGMQPEHFVEPEKVRYKSFDDLEIPALYYKPKDTVNYPVLVWIHGGPTGQHYNLWDPFIQLFTLNGIAVFAPNVRGSTGFGREFENKVFHDWGGGDLEDVVRGLEYIKSDPNADQEKIMVSGGSYGGYMTMMAVTRYPEKWACGMNFMGPVNLETFYHTSTPWMRPVLAKKYGFKPPDEDPEYYYNRSPINFIDRIKCPVLILYGKNDPRVPIEEMFQLREKMEAEGIVYEHEVFETEGHTIDRLQTRIKVFKRMLQFMKKYVIEQETVEV